MTDKPTPETPLTENELEGFLYHGNSSGTSTPPIVRDIIVRACLELQRRRKKERAAAELAAYTTPIVDILEANSMKRPIDEILRDAEVPTMYLTQDMKIFQNGFKVFFNDDHLLLPITTTMEEQTIAQQREFELRNQVVPLSILFPNAKIGVDYAKKPSVTVLIPPRLVLYVAHPLAGELEANLKNAARWLNWLRTRFPETTFIAPWIAAVWAGADDNDLNARTAGINDALAVLDRIDGCVLCGGRISSGMEQERKRSVSVYDLTSLGWSVPQDPNREVSFHLWAVHLGLHQST